MNGARTFYGTVDEDAPFSVIHRVTALDGTGSELIQGEGKCVKVADLSSITLNIWDLGTDRDALTGTLLAGSPITLSPLTTYVFDTLRTTGWSDAVNGYNFRHDVAATYTADPGEWRLLEYKFTLSGGAVFWIEWRVQTRSKATS